MERERIILADMPELSVTLLELAREHGRITVAEACRITDASRHTIKDHLKPSSIKGTSSCTVRAAVLGTVFRDQSDVRQI